MRGRTSRTRRRFVFGLVALLLMGVVLGVGSLGREHAIGTVAAQGGETVTATPESAPPPTAPVITTIEELMVFLADDDPSLGSEDGPVVIVEFSDYLCPYCGKFYLETLPQILEDYPDQVQYVHRDYPIFGDTSVVLALSAGCAIEQDKFWDLHRVYLSFFEDTDFEKLAAEPKDPERFQEMMDYYSEERIMELADSVGLDLDSFAECMSEQRYLDEIIYDYQVGAQLEIPGLPFFVINGQPIYGAQPYELFQQVIELSLEDAAAS